VLADKLPGGVDAEDRHDSKSSVCVPVKLEVLKPSAERSVQRRRLAFDFIQLAGQRLPHPRERNVGIGL
jgi:hypothetical protein